MLLALGMLRFDKHDADHACERRRNDAEATGLAIMLNFNGDEYFVLEE